MCFYFSHWWWKKITFCQENVSLVRNVFKAENYFTCFKLPISKFLFATIFCAIVLKIMHNFKSISLKSFSLWNTCTHTFLIDNSLKLLNHFHCCFIYFVKNTWTLFILKLAFSKGRKSRVTKPTIWYKYDTELSYLIFSLMVSNQIKYIQVSILLIFSITSNVTLDQWFHMSDGPTRLQWNPSTVSCL